MSSFKQQLDDIQRQINELEAQKKEVKKKELEERRKKNNEFISFLRENKEVVLGLFPDYDFNKDYCHDGYYTDREGNLCVDRPLSVLGKILEDEWEDRFEVSFDVNITPIYDR